MKVKELLRSEEVVKIECNYRPYKFYGILQAHFDELPTDARKEHLDKEIVIARSPDKLKEMAKLQEKLYADGREGLIIIFQSIDAGGKDSTIKHVIGGMNPAGVYVYSFKQPSLEELSHDYLWRFHKVLPKRGEIAIFNRSYYEDVLTVQLHHLEKGYRLPKRISELNEEDFFTKRYQQINGYEKYLYQNGYRVVKIFLHVSKEEQKKRFMDRLTHEEKHWKFSPDDLKERAHFEEYMALCEEVINQTATKHAPWYVIPADDKWYTRYLVSEIIIDTLKACHPRFPEASDEIATHLDEYKRELNEE